jgi:CRP/FNR family transcriptional regulator, cyclic AMP receptor protein
MSSILDNCVGAPRRSLSPEAVLIVEGEKSGRLYILVEGTVEVLRGDTQVAVVDKPGSMFGEMSVLLNAPHTATVRAVTPVTLCVVDDAHSFLRSHPDIAFYLSKLLAERLNAATTYLVDLKQQFEGHGNHLNMVGEVLEALVHQQQRDLMPIPEGKADPRL